MATKKTAKKTAPRRPAAKAKKKTAKKTPAKKTQATKKRRGNKNQQSVVNELDALRKDAPVIALYRQGIRVADIALRLNMEPRRVRESIKRTREKWSADNVEGYQAAVDRFETIALHIIDLAFAGYQESKLPDKLSRKTITESEHSSETYTEESREPATGDPRFLAVAERVNYQLGQAHGIFDRDARTIAASSDAKAGLIEIVIKTADEHDRLQQMDLNQMSFEQLQELVVDADAVQPIEAP